MTTPARGPRPGTRLHRVRRLARDAEAYGAFNDAAEIPMLVLSVVFVLVVVAPLVVELSPETATLFEAVSWFVWAVFTAEYLVKLYLAPDRGQMVRTHLPDLAIIVLPLLRPLRVLGVVRLLRPAAGIVRATVALHRVLDRPAFRGFLLMVGVVIVSCAAVAWSFEQEAAEANITSLGDALWWAIVTATTVGYGDRYPVTPEGRGVAVVLMLLGISLLSVVTANIAAFFLERGRDEEQSARDAQLADLQARLDRIEGLLTSGLPRFPPTDRA